MSVLRNDREVFAGEMPWLTTRHTVSNRYRVEIDFPGVLDEAFGVAAKKQGVRLKDHVRQAIKEAVREDITTINEEIKRFQAQQAASGKPGKASPGEVRATEVDAFQQFPIEDPSPEEAWQLEENLRGLATILRREGERKEEAFGRVMHSKYLIDVTHDELSRLRGSSTDAHKRLVNPTS